MIYQQIPIGEIAPPRPSDWWPEADGTVWVLNLDKIASGSDEVLDTVVRRVTELSSSTTAFDTRHVLYSKLRPNLNKVHVPAQRGICTSELLPLLPDERRLSRQFLAHYLRSPQFVNWAISKTDGAKMPRLKSEEFKSHLMPVPSLSEQKLIVSMLNSSCAVRHKRAESLLLVDKFIRSVHLSMFGGPSGSDMGWKVQPLGDLCRIRRGASPRPISEFLGGGVPWIKIGDASDSDDVYITKTEEAVTEAGAERSVRLQPGAFVFANCGVSLGFARILRIEGCIHDGWLAFDEFSDDINQHYLLSLINIMTPTLRRIAPEGTQPNLNTSIMKALEIPVPPVELQRRFSEIFLKAIDSKGLIRSAGKLDDELYLSLCGKFFGTQQKDSGSR